MLREPANFQSDGKLADQFSWNHGKHTIRAGLEYERDRLNSSIPGDSIGALTFQTFQDFLLGLPGCAPGTYPTSCSATNPGRHQWHAHQQHFQLRIFRLDG